MFQQYGSPLLDLLHLVLQAGGEWWSCLSLIFMWECSVYVWKIRLFKDLDQFVVLKFVPLICICINRLFALKSFTHNFMQM